MIIQSPSSIGSLSGTATVTLPDFPVGETSIFLEINSFGGNSGVLFSLNSGFSVEFDDNFAITLNLGARSARFLTQNPLNRFVQLTIVRTGILLRDWHVYLNGQRGLFDVGSSDTNTTGELIFPATATFPAFNGLRRNFFIREGVSDGFSKGFYTDVGSTLQMNGLGNGTLTTGTAFVQDYEIPFNINRFPYESNRPFRLPFDFPSGFCGGYFSRDIATRKGVTSFRLSGVGTLKVKKVCVSGYEEDEVVYTFISPEDLVTQFNIEGWRLTYSVSGDYTLEFLGGTAPDFAEPCFECASHYPYIYQSRNSVINIPARNIPLSCSNCETNETCYLYLGFENICVTITRNYACINDRVKEFSITNGEGYFGDTIVLNGVFTPSCTDVLHLKWFNNNQLERNISIFGAIYDFKLKSNNEVSISSKGVTRKLYNQTFFRYSLKTDYYTYDVIELLNEAMNADHFQVLINGKWQEFTLEEGIELEDEKIEIPTAAKITAVLTRKEFTITNDFI